MAEQEAVCVLQKHRWSGRHLGLRDGPHEVRLARHLGRRRRDELARPHGRTRERACRVVHVLEQLPRESRHRLGTGTGGVCDTAHDRSRGRRHAADRLADRLARRTSEAIAFAGGDTVLRSRATHLLCVSRL